MFGFFSGAKAAMDVKKATALQAEFDAFWKHVESLSPAGKAAVAEAALAIVEKFRELCLQRLKPDQHWNIRHHIGATGFLDEGEAMVRQAHSNMYSSDRVAIGYAQAVAGYYIRAQGIYAANPDMAVELAALQRGYTPPGLAAAQITDTIGGFISESAGKEIKSFGA